MRSSSRPRLPDASRSPSPGNQGNTINNLTSHKMNFDNFHPVRTSSFTTLANSLFINGCDNMETPPPEYQVANENKAPEAVDLQGHISADDGAAAEAPHPRTAPSPSVTSQAEDKDERRAGAQGEGRHVHWADHDLVVSIDELNMPPTAMRPSAATMPPPAKTTGKRKQRVSNTPDPALIVDAPRGRKRTKKAAENEVSNLNVLAALSDKASQKRKRSKDSGYGGGDEGVAELGPVQFVTERERSAHLWGKSQLPKKDAKMKEAVALVAEKEELEQKRLG